MTVFKKILLLLVATSLIACSGNGIHVTAEFANTQDIKEGEKVCLLYTSPSPRD